MKIAVADLKKALNWIEANSRDLLVRVEMAQDGRNLSIKCEDVKQVQVDITLFNDSNMQPRIKKEDAL